MRIVIGTRASKLAMTQTSWVVQRLHTLWPDLKIEVTQVHTTGDKVTHLPLAQIGGDGVFVTEIERALHEGRIDLAVHSLKDLPTQQPEDLRLVIPGPREDASDVLITREPFHLLHGGLSSTALRSSDGAGFRIGTCSLRRMAQIRRLLPAAQLLPLRGNVDTRLRKLRAGEYDAIILASAGVRRLDLVDSLDAHLLTFPLDVLLPAPGQGALAIECRDESRILSLLEPLRDRSVQAATSAERAFMRRLGAGCYLPVAAHGTFAGGALSLDTLVADLDGQRTIRVQQSILWVDDTSIAAAEQLGVDVAEQALSQGAQEIIRALSVTRGQEHQHV